MRAWTDRAAAFYRVWRIPLVLAATTVFGLLSALLGSGIWHVAAWIALVMPVWVAVRFGSGRKNG
nr:hypothetical protein [Paraburkholderia caballeronis]